MADNREFIELVTVISGDEKIKKLIMKSLS